MSKHHTSPIQNKSHSPKAASNIQNRFTRSYCHSSVSETIGQTSSRLLPARMDFTGTGSERGKFINALPFPFSLHGTSPTSLPIPSSLQTRAISKLASRARTGKLSKPRYQNWPWGRATLSTLAFSPFSSWFKTIHVPDITTIGKRNNPNTPS